MMRLVPQDYTTIQSAINSSNINGDTIMVSPGSYIENIDYSGKNIYLTSEYIFTMQDSTIQQTIIDGNQNGSVVMISNYETDATVLNGFTITNGSGFSIGSSNSSSGGGIYIYNSNPQIKNCIIRNNFCYGSSGGGGIKIHTSTAYLSNLTITRNYSDYTAGGLRLTNAEIIMDSINRCSIYLNEAGEHNDIYNGGYYYDVAPTIYLDTASVNYLDSYFIGGDFELIDIQSGILEKKSYDLYVSPNGDNENSGADADNPLKNITYALHVIDADSLNPRNIFLLPGTYSLSTGQEFPLNLRSYVSFIGSGTNETIFDFENIYHKPIIAFDYEKYYKIQSMRFINSSGLDMYGNTNSVVYLLQNTNLVIEDVVFESNSLNCISSTYLGGTPMLDNTDVIIKNCDFINNIAVKCISMSMVKDIYIQNCNFIHNTPFSGNYPEFNNTFIAISIPIYDHYPYSPTRRVENCAFINNIDENHEYFTGVTFLAYKKATPPLQEFEIINCSFIENSSLYHGAIGIGGSYYGTIVKMVNNLFWNNSLNDIYIEEGWAQPETPARLIMANNLILGLEDGLTTEGDNLDIIWDIGNISADPLFFDPENNDYTLRENSPCIDAGTAFYVFEGDTILNLSPEDYYGDAPDIGAYEWRPDTTSAVHPITLPGNVAIRSIYPNPFNTSTTIEYQLPTSGKMKMEIYDIQGRLVKTLIDAYTVMGEHHSTFDLDYLASGTYVLKINTKSGYRDSRKISIVK